MGRGRAARPTPPQSALPVWRCCATMPVSATHTAMSWWSPRSQSPTRYRRGRRLGQQTDRDAGGGGAWVRQNPTTLTTARQSPWPGANDSVLARDLRSASSWVASKPNCCAGPFAGLAPIRCRATFVEAAPTAPAPSHPADPIRVAVDTGRSARAARSMKDKWRPISPDGLPADDRTPGGTRRSSTTHPKTSYRC